MGAAPAALSTLSIPSVRRLFWIVVLALAVHLAVQIGSIVLPDRPWQAWRRRRGWAGEPGHCAAAGPAAKGGER